MSMISSALITGGVFNQSVQVVNDQRHISPQKSAIDRLQEAVAHLAFHNAGERFDPPKCHPNTRVAVRDKIEKWALRMDPDTKDASILWLSGAAGAGKSAIAQTVAEDFHSKGLLIASFFFGRSDASRNHARSLVATIAYQLYSLLPPPEQGRILAVVDRDPLIFTKSFLAQFEALIVIPLRPLFESGCGSSIDTPRLIIIDGLDECLDRGMQRNVLLMLSASVHRFHLPFIFLLASRPELDIQTTFSSPDFLPIHARLFLDDTYLPDRDIELFLRNEFQECRTSHPFGHLIPQNWPSEEIVKEITRKSSGQFIYASVVAKYVKSPRHRPDHRLDIVMKLRPASRDLPFSELDVLYTHILSNVDDIERVLDVIGFHILFQNVILTVDVIECILDLAPGEIPILLCDLASIISVPEHESKEPWLRILHASLADFLLDSSRSKEYFIDFVKRRDGHATACFQFLSAGFQDERASSWADDVGILDFFADNLLSLELTESLYQAINFSIPHIYSSLIKRGFNDNWSFRIVTCFFLPVFFEFLQKEDSARHLQLLRHHQSEVDLFFRENMEPSWSMTPISLFFALVTIYRKLPTASFQSQFCLFDRPHFDEQALAIFQFHHVNSDTFEMWGGYLEYISSFLQDPKRSREFCAGPKLFAQAAKHCLLYLCNHTAPAQKFPRRMLVEQCMRRKNTPWKWRRRVIREDIRGPHDTPWFWLHYPPHSSLDPYILHRKTNDLIYVHDSMPDYGLSGKNSPVVHYRLQSEKYHLALNYLNYFLPRAAKLDSLVDMCQRLRLASRSQDFPRKSARARSNMQKYVAQWE